MFGVRTSSATADVPAYVMKAEDALKLRSTSVNGGYRSVAAGELVILNGTTDALRAVLERVLDRPVIDETGIDGNFDFELSWNHEDIDTLRNALKTTLGIDLAQADRRVEMLYVSIE